jgi:diguanylate cyclase (GGDEF)-like protein
VLCQDGSWKWVLTRGMVISRDAQGQPLRMIGTHTDISQRKASEATIWQQAHFDTLTGLPNRRLLRERLAQELKKCRRDGLQLALLFIDLDRFKEVNDTLGHDRGDQLLAEAARRITHCLREVDTVARMGGDEFMVIVSELPQVAGLEAVLNKLLMALGQVFQLGLDQVFISASIGVTVYPGDALETEDLLKNADQALYAAKGAGRNRFSFFTPALQEAAQWRAQLTRDLRVALAQAQFRVVYQPIVELSSGAVHKAEALVRWQHPLRGLISPAEFIPVAESSGLIVPLGEWVFQQAADQVKAWRTSLHPDFQISVNKSPVQFENPDPLALPWIAQLQARGLGGDSIVVEITEGLLLSTSPGVAGQLLGLGADGIQVSLDDFGTGYSSLAYLQKFDIDFIKIDQSFVRQLAPGSTDLALCQAILAMAHALGMKVIAEGIETEEQRALLVAAGCDYGQGYLFSRPVPAADFAVASSKIAFNTVTADWSI